MNATIEWHPATESPGKRRVIMAFTKKNLKPGQYLFTPVRYFSEDIIPTDHEFKDAGGEQMLPVAWTYYNNAIKGITGQMCKDAADAAARWWSGEL